MRAVHSVSLSLGVTTATIVMLMTTGPATATKIPAHLVRPAHLRGAVKTEHHGYPWGSHRLLQQHLGLSEHEVLAEYWISTHSGGVTEVKGAVVDGAEVSLAALIAAHPRLALGENAAAALNECYGTALPVIVKQLAARLSLSPQSHPDGQQAQLGFGHAEVGQFFRDDLLKAELARAVTEFPLIYGFRERDQAQALLDLVGASDKSAVGQLLAQLRKGGFEPVFMTLMQMRQPEYGEARRRLVAAALQFAEHAAREQEAEFRLVGQAIQKLAAQNLEYLKTGAGSQSLVEFDPAIVFPLILNTIVLQPGEALFQAPGFVHGYLGELEAGRDQGFCTEVIDGGDNVLRYGMTPKLVADLPLLNQHGIHPIDFRSARPSDVIIRPQGDDADPTLRRYPVPSEVFAYSEIHLGEGGNQHAFAGPRSVHLLAALDGQAQIAFGPQGAERFALRRGDHFWAPAASGNYTISGDDAVIQRVELVPDLH